MGPNHPYYKKTEELPGHSYWRFRVNVDGLPGRRWWEALNYNPNEARRPDHAEIRGEIQKNDPEGRGRWVD